MTRSRPSTDSIPTPAFSLQHLAVAYGDRVVLDDATVEFHTGKMTAVVGPNGAGKSTLLKAMLGLIPKLSGEVRLMGEPYKLGDRRVAYLPQREAVDWDFPVSVRDVALMGTYAKIGWLRRPGRAEHQIAAQALRDVGLEELADRQIGQLSGGQQQRVFLARALAQQAEVLVMDEPFAGVDAATEASMVEVLRAQLEQGKTIIAVHHDLDTVRDRFDDVVLVQRTVVSAGPIADTLTEDNLRRAYGARVILD